MIIKEYTDLSKEEIVSLYNAVGWSAYTKDPDSLLRGYRNSLLVLAAYEDNRLAGIIRVVGDACTIIFVQDIIVAPDYQRKGIGTALLKQILDRYSHVRQIELVTDNTPGTISFYRSMGFQELSEMGCRGFMRITAP